MIEDYLNTIMSKLDDIEPVKTSSHFPKQIIEPIEDELLLSKVYVRGKPKGYPSGFGERKLEARSLKKPTNAKYLQMLLRVGITTLHIKDSQTKQNLDAVILVYTGEAETKDIVGPAKAHLVEEAAYTALLENGVISASYFTATNLPVYPAHVISWCPEGKEGYGGWPYPKNKSGISDRIEELLNISGISEDSRAFRALPDLVMLAADTYRECNPDI